MYLHVVLYRELLALISAIPPKDYCLVETHVAGGEACKL
jgi:hypothetical protein